MTVFSAARLPVAALALLLLVFGLASTPTDSFAQPVIGGVEIAKVHADGPLMWPDLDHTCGLQRVDYDRQYAMPPHPHAGKAMKQTANIIVDYGPGFSQNPEAQTAFQRAVNTWSQHISTPVTIRIDASFADLGRGVLGAAGPLFVQTTLTDGTQEWVSIPLLEAVTGQPVEDQFNINRSSADAEIQAQFNRGRSDWNFSEAPPTTNQIDFESVVLHEIGHGLQYLSTFEVDGECFPGRGCFGLDGEGVPSGFDRFLVEFQSQDNTQTPLTSLPNNSAQMADAIQVSDTEFGSTQIRFDGPQASENSFIGNGPEPPIMFFPGVWNQGSSGSHLDEQTYAPGSEDALMTPELGSGETARRPGAVVCGTLNDLGWPLGPGCAVSADRPFNLNIASADSATGEVVLEWFITQMAEVEQYTVRRQRFDEPFEVVATLPGDTDPRYIDSGLALGTYTYALDFELPTGGTGTVNTQPSVTLTVSQIELNASPDGERSQVDLGWVVPPATTGFTYLVERRPGQGQDTPFQTIGQTSATSFTQRAVAPGSYDYRISAVSSDGDVLESQPLEFEIEVDGEVFVSGPNPNPTTTATSDVRIDLTPDRSQPATVSMYNTVGQRIYEDVLQLQGDIATSIQIPVRELSSGIYFIRINGRFFDVTQKMAVTR